MGSTTEQKIVEIIIKGASATATVREIESAARVLNAELKKLPVNSQEFKDKAAQLGTVNTRLKSIRDDIKEVSGGFKEASETTKVFGDILKGMLGAELIMKGIAAIKEFGSESIKAFQDAQKSAHDLNFAIENIAGEGNGSLKKLLDQAKELAEKGNFFHADIENTQKLQVQFGLTSKEVEKLTPLIVDLASAQGISLEEATTKCLSAINGQAKGLRTAGIAFKDTGDKTENLSILTEKLTKFQGANAAALETAAGQAQLLNVELEEQEELVGPRLSSAWLSLKRFALEGLGQLMNIFSSSGRAINNLTHETNGLTGAQAKLLVGLGFVQKQVKYNDEDIARAKGLLNYSASLDSMVDSLAKNGASVKSYSLQIVALEKEQATLNQLTDAGKVKFNLNNQAILKLSEASKKLTDSKIEENEKEKVSENDLTKLTIRALNDRLEAVKASEGEFSRLTIQGQTKEEERINKEIKKREEFAKKILEAQEKLDKELITLREEADARFIGKDALELAHIDAKYEKLLSEAKGYKDKEAKINQLYAEEYADVLQRQQIANDALAKKANDKMLADKDKWDNEVYLGTLSASDRERVVIMQKYEKLTEAAGANKDEIIALKKQEEAELNDITVKAGQKELAAKKKLKAEEIKALKEFEQQVISIVDSYATIEANKDTVALNQNDKNLATELAQYDQQLKNKRTSQATHDKLVLAAQKKHDAEELAIKKKAFERDQKIAIFKTLIDGAEGSAKIWATYADVPYVAAALQIVEAAVIAAQIAAIKSEPKPYASGGYNKKSNDPQGFTSGATLYNNSASGQPFIAGEAGKEWIAPNWMTTAPQTAPIIEHLENIRQNRSFAIGGSNAVKSTPGASTNNQQQSTNNQELCDAVNRLNGILDSGIEARLNYDLYTRDITKIDNAKSAARVG